MFAERLADAIGADAVKTAPEDLAVYAFDAYSESAVPRAVALPASARDVAAIVRIARECGEPIVARGAGTGLCGGAIPARGGVVVSFARMNRMLELDVRNRRARVQPGLINLDLSKNVATAGLFYAPDPSSQKACTIGGNIGTNAGGPHCLTYGTTVNHVLGLEVVDERGEVYTTSLGDSGYDLTGALVGSEGTLGIVTSAWVRLLRVPEATRVWVATFADVEAASEAVSAIVGHGIVPTALEMMDGLMIRTVEAAFHSGFPTDAEALLLIENAGYEDDMDACEHAIEKICKETGALTWRAAKSQAERDGLWAARKGAFGAAGRIAPNTYLQDVVVPRTKLPQMLKLVDDAAAKHELTIGNVFHAGDGNLHPLIMYDKRDKRQVASVVEVGDEILSAAVDLGGTISGEHGIGYEKRDTLARVYDDADLDTMLRLRDVFDASRHFNPDKIFPRGASCVEVRA